MQTRAYFCLTQSGHCKLLADIQGREERQDF